MKSIKPSLVLVLAVFIVFWVTSCSSRSGAEGAQGWAEGTREAWYRGSQGSRLIPQVWFDALETVNADQPFSASENLQKFGFLASPDAEKFALPIGVVLDRQDDSELSVSKLRWYEDQPANDANAEPWIGMNCSACHTAKLSYEGTNITVDGGPNLLDFQGFVEAMDLALHATRNDDVKWERFVSRVLKDKGSESNRELLATAFDQYMQWQDLAAEMNKTSMRYGFGRLDAVGHILNKVLMFNGAKAQDGNASNAPVSYPFLWDIWRQQRVQWNGVAENSRLKTPGDPIEYGALGRNTGEVLGVFGDVVITPNTGLSDTIRGYKSSVKTQNLMRMELLLKDLKAPAWPDEFPAINEQRASVGKELFKKDCASCHLTPDLQSNDKPTERMALFADTSEDNLTDIWMACNAYVYQGPTGPMQGTKDNNGNTLAESAPVATMLATAVKGALIGDAGSLVKEGVNNFSGVQRLPEVEFAPDPFDPRAADRSLCLEATDVPILGYKSRPLDGIWATAPYLHNGSVKSLYELLLPAEQRSKTFFVGGREYDPVGVGYVSQDADDAFLLNTALEGNLNVGHEYGVAGLSNEQRWALIEYMKTL